MGAKQRTHQSLSLLRPMRILSLTVLFSLSGCTLIPAEDLAPPPPLALPGAAQDEETGALQAEQETEPVVRQRRITGLPMPASPVATREIAKAPVSIFPQDEVEDIVLSIHNLPLPTFINEVFGNALELDFEMAPDVSDRTDLVTVRITNPRNRQGIYELARGVLESYGVLLVRQGDYLRFVLGKTEATSQPPLIITGAALPSVPESHRPVIFIRGLEVITNAEAYGMLRSIFERDSRITIERDNARNAVRFQGPPEVVQQAAEVLDMLDQPLMRGRHTLRIEPQFIGAELLAERLSSTLKAQGYDIGTAANNTALVPIEALGALFVFAPSQSILSLIRQWIPELDQVARAGEQGKEGLFWYRVRNTTASDLAATLNGMSSGRQVGGVRETDEDRRLQGRSPEGAQTAQSGQFVVNEARNMLLFHGESDRWQQLLPLIRELDVAPEQVLIEVVVAEVTLSDEFRFGIEWALREISAAGAVGSLSSVFGSGAPGAGLDSGGLSWASISGSGNTRLALNAFASSNRVSILQTPRILVRSGEEASVRVGSEVPIITRQATGDETVEGTSAIIQDVQFRSTGVQLQVRPVVFSDGRIDIEISQEVSEAVPTQTSNINSPTILTRNVNTRLSLQDGSSVLLGGLISSSETKGDSRVPLLGDLPGVGQLFRVDSTQGGRTELMVLIVPYLVRDGRQAEQLTESFRSRLRFIEPIESDSRQYSPR
ncbi:type II secretion system protein GspD [Nitrincola tapanii]|uniref:Type II secretion system protein GspD n=1 Tax=Nitrincola tapanii TaxID=1708751 RepID=A0A5A9W0Z8_9GAMM|nr:secretin N-terminal domain-containing protein [Nitrincola tapanii]KAA0874396.1 type II secretion system protein GspD [Nitrincola tapanii]